MLNALAKASPATSVSKDWRPFFDSLVSQMDRTFSDSFSDVWTPTNSAFVPHIDIIEEEQQYLVLVELPGLSDKDIDVVYEDGLLTISGEKKEERRSDTKGYHHFERTYGKFSRSLKLPHKYLNADGISATSRDGILTITIPRISKDSYIKKIEVKT